MAKLFIDNHVEASPKIMCENKVFIQPITRMMAYNKDIPAQNRYKKTLKIVYLCNKPNREYLKFKMTTKLYFTMPFIIQNQKTIKTITPLKRRSKSLNLIQPLFKIRITQKLFTNTQ